MTDSDIQLTPEEYEVANRIFKALRLKYVRHDWRSLNDFLQRWSKIVIAVEQGYQGIVAEYQNDLCCRDMLAEAIHNVPDPISKQLTAILRPWDTRFHEATRDVARPLFFDKTRDDGFLWFRAPRKFRFFPELREFALRGCVVYVPELATEYADNAEQDGP